MFNIKNVSSVMRISLQAGSGLCIFQYGSSYASHTQALQIKTAHEHTHRGEGGNENAVSLHSETVPGALEQSVI